MKNVTRLMNSIFLISFKIIVLTCSMHAVAQWVNQYPKLDDFGHHVYLEQHELPIFAYGITDPAPSPNGESIAFASIGWLWLLDLKSQVATQLTYAKGIDSRPRWSPDGKQLTFVRDFGDDTAVVIKHLETGKESVINSSAIDLDPEFSADSQSLYYTSGLSGSLELYQRHIDSGTQQVITNLRQVVRNTRRVANNQGLVYLHGNGAHRVLRHRNLLAGTDQIIQAQTLTYHLSSDTHPSLPLIVYSAPIDNDYHLWTMDMTDKKAKHRLTTGNSFALTPAFSANGNHIYFIELTDNRQFRLMKINTYGGKASEVAIKRWDYAKKTGTLNLAVKDKNNQPIAARISIETESGHPVANPKGATYMDPQTGRSYFYLDALLDLSLPAGKYQLIAARGPATPIYSTQFTIKPNKKQRLNIALSPLWDSVDEGYVSADFHVHLNGDGHNRATHEDALLLMQGEDLHTLSPMSWNRWERRIDSQIIGKRTGKTTNTQNHYQVIQGQEVRSHFHGHIGLLNLNEPFAPWFFGPSNPVLGDPDLTNADVFAYANKVGAFATYVHPIATDGDPFATDAIAGIPLELVSDGVLEEAMGLELVCAWTSPLGNANLWYRFLNIGRPVAAMSGTDGWVDFYRTPAMGTGRAYIRPLENSGVTEPVIAGALAGRSFVTTGPILTFSVGDNIQPGDTIIGGEQKYSLKVTSTVSLEKVEIVVNGKVVHSLEGVKAGKTKSYQGKVQLPEGGWLAARAYSEQQRADSWPTMHARPFAHSSPIWINQKGSIDKASRAAAAADMIRAIDNAEKRAQHAYGQRPMPRLYKRFSEAKSTLEKML
ncbi:CehA/McbA family metallohydrolase [Paraglaciecola aestuariivivens]